MNVLPFPCNGLLLCCVTIPTILLMFFNKFACCFLPFFNSNLFSIANRLALALNSFRTNRNARPSIIQYGTLSIYPSTANTTNSEQVYSNFDLCQIGTVLDLQLVKLDLVKFKRVYLTYIEEEEEVSQR